MKTNSSQLTLEPTLQETTAPRFGTICETVRNPKRFSLYRRYADKLLVNPELTRPLVSFQANKDAPFYRWLKYKEAFSSEFVAHILEKFKPTSGTIPRVLDPFAGAGTTLTRELGEWGGMLLALNSCLLELLRSAPAF